VTTIITDYRDTLIAAIKTAVPDFRLVDWHEGIFEPNDILDLVLKAPVAMCSSLSMRLAHHSTGELEAKSMMAVYVICESKRKARDSDAQAWDLMARVALLINNNRLGFAAAGVPNDIRGDRLGEPSLRKQGISLGCVTWEQSLMLGTNKEIARGTDPALFRDMKPPAPSGATRMSFRLDDGELI
jgi:hypothetical protein